jgi:hypothetical protein
MSSGIFRKGSIMKLKYITLIALLGAAVAAPTLAQPGPGMGGMGMGGMGPGQGSRFAFNKDNTTGWALMTTEERTAHRQKMWSFKTYDECKAYQDEHHKAMEAKAKEQGKTLPAPRNNACDRMKAHGVIK